VRGAATTLRHELIGLSGVLERNAYLVKRYAWWELAFFVWSLANTLTIVFIAKGIDAAGGKIDVDRATTTLLIGAVIWSYLGVVFEILTETVAWERWEGTIEYTFMAPLARPIHLIGMGLFAVVYGVIRTAVLFAVIASFFSLHLGGANFVAALIVLAVASVSFIGIGMMTAVLPLISPEKGMQMGFIAQGILLVISGVYYSVSVLPQWMQWLSTISPATYALRGIRHAILDGYSVSAVWGDIWPLIVIGFVAIPAGLWIFGVGERHDPGFDLKVLTDRGIGDLFDLGSRGRRQRLVPVEVEPHVAGLVVRAGLVRLRAENLTQRCVDEVGRRVRLGGPAAPLRIHDARRGVSDSDLAGAHLYPVADESLDRTLDIEHLEVETSADDAARIRFLATGLRVERGLGEDDLRNVARHGASDGDAVDDDPQHGGIRREVVVPREGCLPHCTEFAVHGEVREQGLLCLGIGLGHSALLGHERVEGVAVDGEPRFIGHLER